MLKATLATIAAVFGLLIMRNGAVLQRNPTTTQKMPTSDNGGLLDLWGGKNVEEYQQLVHNYYYLYILKLQTLKTLVEGSRWLTVEKLKRVLGKLQEEEPNTVNMAKPPHKPSSSESSTPDQDTKASMPKEILTGKEEKKQPDDKRAKKVEEKQRRGEEPLIAWRKKMLRRLG